MEGKSILFKHLRGVEAFPICVATQDVDEIVDIVLALEPTFGGINLEDIAAPRCFAIEERLRHLTDIPVFHDDQHGTAVVVLAGLINALKLVGKDLAQVRVVMNGAGAAGIACTKLLMAVGVSDVILCDRAGAVYEGRPNDMNWLKEEIARVTNRGRVRGSLADAVRGADVFIGVSAPGVLTLEMIYSMARKPIIFALANPTPEIMPDLASNTRNEAKPWQEPINCSWTASRSCASCASSARCRSSCSRPRAPRPTRRRAWTWAPTTTSPSPSIPTSWRPGCGPSFAAPPGSRPAAASSTSATWRSTSSGA